MRTKSVIFLAMFAILFVMASTNLSLWTGQGNYGLISSDSTVIPKRPNAPSPKRLISPNDQHNDTIFDDFGDVVALRDTLEMDSLQRAIYRHNQQVDDSIRLDSIHRARSNGIESPVTYAAEDSLVYDATTKTAYLYGSSTVKYQNMNLASDRIYMSIDSSMVRATGTADSTAEKGIRGIPQFSMGKDEYESDTIAFNFKTKKGFIQHVYTEQQEGFLTGEIAKRDSSGIIYMQHARYTTCDDPHPDFYIALSRAKVRPNKDVVFGPAYLVVADVPLPLAIPYGFFPFSKKYSSGFIMPSYGDEQDRGFYLRDGGYYFAISDKWDLKLLGEIYTRGSWGLSAASNYRKRYKYSGSFLFSYQNTKSGDKGMPDYSSQKSFKLQWHHSQDSKANPFSTLTANVNFATSSYERNNLNSMYNPQTMTQSTRTSSVSYNTTFSSLLGMTLGVTANLNQNMRDTTITMLLPSLNVNIPRFYPFRRKVMVGKERWYEKISVSYTGELSNSITAKEDHILKANLIKEWQNGMQHQIPIQATFPLFNYINVTPNFSFRDRMYTHKVMRSWDEGTQSEVADTIYGFNNVYDWNFSLGLTTKLYGMYIPNKKIFGDKILAVRHVFTPTVTMSYSPDFGSSHYGYWDNYIYTDANGEVHSVTYSPYSNSLYGVPSAGKSESFSFSISNNIEMKVKSDKDTTGVKKISIIDELGLNMSYNAAAKERRWSDINMTLRLKWWKNYTFSMNARFAMYAYELDENGMPYVGTHTEFGKGRFPRFQGMNQNIHFTLNPEKLRKWFGGGGDDDDETTQNDDGGVDPNIESNVDETMEQGKHAAKKKNKSGKAKTDDDGYMLFNMPWSLTFSYGISMRESSNINKFDYKRMRYRYEFSQNLNVSGNIRISDGWNINFSSGYDFENHKISMTTASLSRDLHCFNMSCSVVLAPYTSYNFTFRCNASTLTDALKYDKHSGVTNVVKWY